jgi:hypothetical protein
MSLVAIVGTLINIYAALKTAWLFTVHRSLKEIIIF